MLPYAAGVVCSRTVHERNDSMRAQHAQLGDPMQTGAPSDAADDESEASGPLQ